MNIGVALVYKYTVGKTMQEHNLNITIGPVNHSGEGFQVSIEPGNAVSSDYLFSVGGCRGYIHPSMISVRVVRWQEFKGGMITGDTVVELPNLTGCHASYEGIRTAESFDKWVTIQVRPNKKPTDAVKVNQAFKKAAEKAVEELKAFGCSVASSADVFEVKDDKGKVIGFSTGYKVNNEVFDINKSLEKALKDEISNLTNELFEMEDFPSVAKERLRSFKPAKIIVTSTPGSEDNFIKHFTNKRKETLWLSDDFIKKMKENSNFDILKEYKKPNSAACVSVSNDDGDFMVNLNDFTEAYLSEGKELCHAAKTLESALTTLSKAKDTEDDYLITCAELAVEESRDQMAHWIELFEKNVEQHK